MGGIDHHNDASRDGARAPPELDGARERVVLVERRRATRAVLAGRIEALGHAVTATHSASAALAELEARDAAALVASIRDDGDRGLGLVLRARRLVPDLRCVLTADRVSTDTALAALRAGVTDVVVDPTARPEAFAAAVGRAVDEHRTARERRIEGLALRAARDHLEQVLHDIPLGVLVVDRGGRVLFANAAARSLLGAQNGLKLGRSGELRTSAPRDAAAMTSLLATACALGTAAPRGGVLAVGGRAGERPLSIRVEPLPCGGPCAAVTGPVAAVLVGAPDRRFAVAPEAVREVYGLTPAEAAVAAALVRAGALDHAARALGISVGTARTHLKRAFCKTSTKRQGELVGLLLSGPAVYRARPA